MLVQRSNYPSMFRDLRNWFRTTDPFSWFVRRDERNAPTIANDVVCSTSEATEFSSYETDRSVFRARSHQLVGDPDIGHSSGVNTNYDQTAFSSTVSNGNGVITDDGLSPLAAAALFNDVAGKTIDISILHKLLYFSEVATRHLSGGARGFVNGNFVAAETGPKLRDLEGRAHTGNLIPTTMGSSRGSPYMVIAKHTYELFGRLPSGVLSEISHVPGGVWEKAREKKANVSDGVLVMEREQIMSDYHKIFENNGSS